MPEERENGVTKVRVAVLTLTLNIETGSLDVGGSVPSHELAKAMCQMAADDLERSIAARRMRHSIEVAGPQLLDSLKARQ